MDAPTEISVTDLSSIIKTGQAHVIDVRTPVEFQEVHAVDVRNVPLNTIDSQTIAAEVSRAGENTLYVICKAGGRGRQAVQKFHEAGVTNVVNVTGGTDAWVAAGLSVNRGRKAVSLERQVRIAAGSIVFTGAVSAILTQNVYLAGIPAFVGAGLVFAGVTDTCAMGLLIARMPWNRVASAS